MFFFFFSCSLISFSGHDLGGVDGSVQSEPRAKVVECGLRRPRAILDTILGADRPIRRTPRAPRTGAGIHLASRKTADVESDPPRPTARRKRYLRSKPDGARDRTVKCPWKLRTASPIRKAPQPKLRRRAVSTPFMTTSRIHPIEIMDASITTARGQIDIRGQGPLANSCTGKGLETKAGPGRTNGDEGYIRQLRNGKFRDYTQDIRKRSRLAQVERWTSRGASPETEPALVDPKYRGTPIPDRPAKKIGGGMKTRSIKLSDTNLINLLRLLGPRPQLAGVQAGLFDAFPGGVRNSRDGPRGRQPGGATVVTFVLVVRFRWLLDQCRARAVRRKCVRGG